MTLLLIIFIIKIEIYFGQFFGIDAVDPIHSCGGTPISEMEKELKYHSFLGLPPAEVKIFMKEEHDFAGNFGRVNFVNLFEINHVKKLFITQIKIE